MKRNSYPRMKVFGIFPSILLLLLFGVPLSTQATPGNLDPGFGTGGKVTTAIGAVGDSAYAVAIQPDGKLVAAGYTNYGTSLVPLFKFALVRYNTDGSLDATFGAGGKVDTAFGTVEDIASALVIQPDGKIVAGGYTLQGTDYQFALARYNTDGSLDVTFGTGGTVTTIIGSDAGISKLLLQPDGKIVAGGYTLQGTDYQFALARYNTDGSLDTTFGTGGKVTTEIGDGDYDYDGINGLVIQPDGKIVAAGVTYSSGSQTKIALVRYSSDGSIDTTFGTSGIVTTTSGGGAEGGATALEIQPDGKLMVAGYSYNDSLSRYEFMLARYTTAGAPDGTFGTGGIVTTPVGDNDDLAFILGRYAALGLQPDGKPVVAGYSYDNGLVESHFVVVRYNTNGSLDTSFGSGGKQVTPFGTVNDKAHAIAIQPDGKIVVVGFAFVDDDVQEFALARYLGGLTITMPLDSSLCTADYNSACAFSPNPLTIDSGDSVAWRNADGSISHTATSDDHADDLVLTQPVAPDNSFSTAMIAGDTLSDSIGPFINTTGITQTKLYHCSLHPVYMKGTLIINSAPVPTTTTTTTTITTTTTTLSPPDLIMSAVSFSGSAVDPGAMLPVDNTVENQGTLAAGAVTIAYRLSTDAEYGDGDDIVIATVRKAKSLGAGASESATTNISIPKTALAGNYYVCAKAYSASKVIESNETNNTLCSAGTIHVNRPDLVMSAVSFSASMTYPGMMLPVDNTVKNQGALAAGAVTIVYRLSTDTMYGNGDDVTITDPSHPGRMVRLAKSLGAGASESATTNILIPKTVPTGDYHVCAKADSLNEVIESDETNNTRCSAGTIHVNRPDLIMSAVSFSAAMIYSGMMLPVDNTVENQGEAATGAFKIAYRLSTDTMYGNGDDVLITTVRPVKSLVAGASESATTNLLIPKTAPAGNYHVCAKADSVSNLIEVNKLIEVDETNNTLCSAGTIHVNRPDLIMSAVSFSAAMVYSGMMLPVDNTVENQGEAATGAFKIDYRLSTDTMYGNGDLLITTVRSVKSLGAGASESATTNLWIPRTVPTGDYHVCAKADSNLIEVNKVIEIDETNNSFCSAGTIHINYRTTP